MWGGAARSELQMDSKRLVELFCELESERTDGLADPLDSDRTNLFGLCLGVQIQSGRVSRQQHLKRIDPISVGRDRHNRDHTLAEASCGCVCAVIAHHDRRTSAGCLTANDRIEIYEADLASTHQLSTTALSHASLVESSAHSVKAAA